MDNEDVETAVELEQEHAPPGSENTEEADQVTAAEVLCEEIHNRFSHWPESHWQNSIKENIALEEAGKYLSQLMLEFPERPEPALIATNEFGVKKLICTFIRPTAVAYPELSTWQGIAAFVSDHTLFRPLQAPTKQQGLNHNEENFCAEKSKLEDVTTYKVKSRRMFESKYIKSVEEQIENKIKQELAEELEQERKRVEEEEKLPDDELEGQRVHYWVLVLPGNCRPEVQEPFFIEAASGKPFSTLDPNYLGTEYAWNHENFWFCRQGKNKTPIDFDFEDDAKWFGFTSFVGNNFEIPLSWIDRIELLLQDYQRRYPGGKKETFYLRSKLLKYSEYSRPDGTVMELINYSDLNWERPLTSKSEFQHRKDFLCKSEHDFENTVTTDCYHPGRGDYIKAHRYYLQGEERREICFYGKCHPFSLEQLTITNDTIVEEFKAHEGESCILKRVMKFALNSKNNKTIEWTEEFHELDPKLPPASQVAQRKYFHVENRIFLKFHRNPGQLTAGYLHFLKPGATNSSVEIFHIYNPFNEKQDVNQTFSRHISDEQKIISRAQGLHAEVQTMLQNLQAERDNPGLKISLFDEERNLDTVRLMEMRDKTLYEQCMSELLDPVDYTAPIIERHGSCKKLIPEDEISKIEEESLKEKEQLSEFYKRTLETNIEFLRNELEKRTASEQKNQLLQGEIEELDKLKFKIEALKLRLARIGTGK